MTGVLLGIAALVLVGAAGALFALLAGSRSLVDVLLAAYVFAFAEVVVLALLLSVFEEFSRTALVAGAALVLLAAIGLALLFGVAPLRCRRPGCSARSSAKDLCSRSRSSSRWRSSTSSR